MSVSEAVLLADARNRLFAPSSSSGKIGAELELIPLHANSKAPVWIDRAGSASLAQLIRRAAVGGGWKEEAGSPPSWNLPGGARLSFEPGGQIEVSSSPHESCSDLIFSLQRIVAELEMVANDFGIELLAVGADPYNDIESVPLQLCSERYVQMDRYLGARGEFGIRMMRRTAALQISVEHGPRPQDRWALLNALAPYMIAIFAGSSVYAGRETAHASYRAHFWRELDASRTGLPFDSGDAASRYVRFALDAGSIRAENGRGEFHSFRSLLGDPSLTMEDWHFHLSTLFPEIRPKEYFEIRSPDAVPVRDLAAPLVFVAGLVYDDLASRAALARLRDPDESLLRSAGKEGLRSPAIKACAAELVELSLDGAARLPAGYLAPDHRNHAAAWLKRRVS